MDEDGKVSLLGLLANADPDLDLVTIALCGSTIVVRSGAFREMAVFNAFFEFPVPGGGE
jgi:hypothetical protein